MTMAAASGSKLTRLLSQTGLFSAEQVRELIAAQQQSGKSVTEVAVGMGYAAEEPFLHALAQAMGVPFVKLTSLTIPDTVLAVLPTKVVFQYHVIPIELENGALRVATNDPFLPGMMDALRLASGKRIQFALSASSDLAAASKTSTAWGPIPSNK
jgi:type IV pilus assembly protein PilB